ncbi:hypothetical protein ASF47_18860 [Nocardioides sp. Leaf285]|nr:hypothetical protein ASF47_18860 [Nocardioides sp. Leaf285]
MVHRMSRFEPIVFTLVRTPGIETNPATLATRANGFVSQIRECDSATLLVHLDEDGLHGYLTLVGPADSAEKAAISIAQAVGARAERADLPATLGDDAPAVARMVYQDGSAVAREGVLGADPTEISRRMEVALNPGDWVALTLRNPTNREDSRNEDWVDFRLGSSGGLAHQSRQPDATVVSIYAGSSDHRAASRLIDSTRSALHGFDLRTRSEPVTVARGALGLALAGLCTGVIAVALVANLLPGLAGLDSSLPLGGAVGVVALVLAALAVLRATGVVPTLAHRVRAGLPLGVLPTPAMRRRRPRAPRESFTNPKSGKKVKAEPGDYPLHRSAFLMAPLIFVGFIAPYSSANASSAGSRRRNIPPRMTQRTGPLFGFDGDIAAYLSIADAYSGIGMMGRAGSGKSVSVRSIFGWACLDRTSPSGIPGSTGPRSTLIAFENKGQGVVEYQRWAETTKTAMLLVDLADPTTFALDLVATRGTFAQRAEAFVNGLAYAFEDGSIKDRAFTSLTAIYTAGLAIESEPDMIGTALGISPTGSFNYYAHVLVGNLGDDLAVALAAEIASRAKKVETATVAVRAAAEALATFFVNATPSSRRALFESSANKVRQLHSLEAWWSPSRPKVSWTQILSTAGDKHRAVLINTGSSLRGHQVADRLSSIMSSLMMQSLRVAIEHTCAEWWDNQRSVSIFADELALLSGSGPEVITWLKDQGRAFGVRPVFATQRPSQLPRAVKEVFLNFGTLVCFNQEDITTANEVAAQLSSSGGEVTADEIMHLSQFHAMVRAYADGERQQPFTVNAYNFESDRRAAAIIQGFSDVAVTSAEAQARAEAERHRLGLQAAPGSVVADETSLETFVAPPPPFQVLRPSAPAPAAAALPQHPEVAWEESAERHWNDAEPAAHQPLPQAVFDDTTTDAPRDEASTADGKDLMSW